MLHMSLKMTSGQVVEMSVNVNNNNNNSSFQRINPDDHTQQTTNTPPFKLLTMLYCYCYTNALQV